MNIPKSFRPEKVPEYKLKQLLKGSISVEEGESLLEGYDGRIFPEGLDKLNKTYDIVNSTGHSLKELGENIKWYTSIGRPTTKDDYSWFWSLHFKTMVGEIAVLFPWCQNWNKPNGLQLDRSIEVHTKGKVNAYELGFVLEKLYQGLSGLKK